jgi:para-nitrobenzyl esterase
MPLADRRALLVAVTTGLWMEGGATKLAGKKADMGGAPAYLYLFGWKEPFLNSEWALHGADVAFVFDKTDMPSLLEEGVDIRVLRARLDPAGTYKKVRDMTMATWGSFARSGNPANSHLPAWPRYGLPVRSTMRLDASPALLNDPLGPDIRALLQN